MVWASRPRKGHATLDFLKFWKVLFNFLKGLWSSYATHTKHFPIHFFLGSRQALTLAALEFPQGVSTPRINSRQEFLHKIHTFVTPRYKQFGESHLSRLSAINNSRESIKNRKYFLELKPNLKFGLGGIHSWEDQRQKIFSDCSLKETVVP
jgi:hypothetical protein